MDFSGSPKDPHSFAKPELARVIHTHLELNVDFERKILIGQASLTIETKLSCNEIILDNNGLNILNITSFKGTVLDYHIDKNAGNLHTDLGTPIYIQLPSETIVDKRNESDTLCRIQIEYATNPKSPALNWLTPAQTADNICPFLLSNNKLIYARAMFPCQDTPSVKFTYSAVITVQKMYTVLMSACPHIPKSKNDLLVEYSFFQGNRIPSYAVIISVGRLEKMQLNSRTNIFSERKYIETCRNTFRSDVLKRMLSIAGNLYGSYIWNTCNICVLPPSIGHFRIDCPCVIFISPMALGGDCSSISPTLAGRISQNWAGLLVTCSNYEHLWLNKSFSLFISRKIICKILTKYCTDINFYLARLGTELFNEIIKKSKNTNLLTCLLPKLTELLPHTVHVPYEQGYNLLRHLEDKLGESVFESFLKSYFHKFANKSINTQDWLDYLYEYIRQFNPDKENILHDTDWNKFFRDIPSSLDVPEYTALENECFDLVKKCINNVYGSNDISVILKERKFSDLQKTVFINYLNFFRNDCTHTSVKLFAYSDLFKIQVNSVRFAWLLLCIKMQWAEQVSPALEFAVEFCSLICASQIFNYFNKWPGARDKAIETYRENREKMFHETQETLDALLFQN